ncbi:MAG TPA: N-6 DNA methylase [Solirubrobacterales bacterium]|nr:N-6 DNA methylase [Solirubrobacterales bacterium]
MTVADVSGAAPSLGLSGHKALGAFYTPEGTADFMADWLIRDGGEHVLEPSLGDGALVSALHRNAAARLLPDPDVIGVELAADTFRTAVDAGLIDRGMSVRGDFLGLDPFPVDAVIGNPPYVRLRNLPEESRRRALRIASRALGRDMDPAGSIWMPFVLHATSFVKEGGRMALVLPHEFTHVRYARPLWRFLGWNFGELRLVRVRERMFSSILQETVLLFADRRGERTGRVEFETYETVAGLVSGSRLGTSVAEIDQIERGEKPFLLGLLREPLRALLEDLSARTHPSAESVKWRIGYVSGDKGFFHPSREQIELHGLRPESLAATLTTGRQLVPGGVSTTGTRDEVHLFVPPSDPADLSPGEREYIAEGVEQGVDRRYKCRIREPWYLIRALKVSDVVLPVFAETPQLFKNDAGLLATNSFMCGQIEPERRDALLAVWYSSLTLLEAELKVHSLGGGVFVFVPSELGAMRLPSAVPDRSSVTDRLKELSLTASRPDEFRRGDEFVLGELLGLGPDEVELIREGAETLRAWRSAGDDRA